MGDKTKVSCSRNQSTPMISSSNCDHIVGISSSSNSSTTITTNTSSSSTISQSASCTVSRNSTTNTNTIATTTTATSSSSSSNVTSIILPSRMAFGRSYNREHLQQLVGLQVSLAMDRFYRVHTRALSKLEQLIMEEVMPRLERTRRGHQHLVDKMLRRLEKLRPIAVRAKAGLHRRFSRQRKRTDSQLQLPGQRQDNGNSNGNGSKQRQKRRPQRMAKMRKQRCVANTSHISGLLLTDYKAESAVNADTAELIAQSQAGSRAGSRAESRAESRAGSRAGLRAGSQAGSQARSQAGSRAETPSQSRHACVGKSRSESVSRSESGSRSRSRSGSEHALTAATLIYLNHAFPTMPASEHSESDSEATDELCPIAKMQAASTVELDKWQSINRQQLKTNLMFNKSSFSLFMNRFKSPAPWPQSCEPLCRPKQKPFDPLPWDGEQ